MFRLSVAGVFLLSLYGSTLRAQGIRDSVVQFSQPKLPIPSSDSIKAPDKSLLKRIPDYLHGTLKLEYLYRNGTYVGQLPPEHTFRYSLEPEIRIGKVPLRFGIGYSTDYSGLNRNLYRFNFQFDVNRFRQELLLRANERLKKAVGTDTLKQFLDKSIAALPSTDYLQQAEDSLRGLMPEMEGTVPDSLRGYRDSLQGRLDEITAQRRRLDELLAMKEKLTASGYFDKRLHTDLPSFRKNPYSLRRHVSFARWEKYALGIESLQIGTASLNGPKLLSNGSQFTGLHAAYYIKGIYLAAFGGGIRRPSTFLFRLPNSPQMTTGYRFSGAAAGLGNGEKSYLRIHYLIGQKHQELNPSLIEADMLGPDRNQVVHVYAQAMMKQNTLYVEAASSRSEGGFIGKTEENATEPGLGIFPASLAGTAGIKGTHKRGNLEYDLNVSRIGQDYYSLLNPYFRTDVKRFTGLVQKSFWRNIVKLRSTYTLEQDNASGKKSFTTQTQRLTNTFTIKYKNYPVLTITDTRLLQQGQGTENLFSFVNRVSVLNMALTYQKKLGKIGLYAVQLHGLISRSRLNQVESPSHGMTGLINYLTLGQFSLSNSSDMQIWKDKVISLGNQSDVGFNGFKRIKPSVGYGYTRDKLRGDRTDLRAGAEILLFKNQVLRTDVRSSRFSAGTRQTFAHLTLIQKW